MKDLPRVFVNKIEKNFENFQKESLIDQNNRNINTRNLSLKIKDIFNSNEYIYRRNVKLRTYKGLENKIIVGKTNDCLLTLNNEKIKFTDIYDIEII